MTDGSESHDTPYRETEFRHEEQHLEAVIRTMDATIEHERGRGVIIAGDAKAADIIKGITDEALEKLESARSKPYFGRVDYALQGDSGEVSTIYIGDINVSHDDPRYFIASYNAPIARLYYSPAEGYYQTPKGRKRASVHLKRMLAIEESQLIDFEDALRLPAPGDTALVSTRRLDEKLSGAGGDGLSDAVETIQPEQYQQIAATDKPVLIIQGAAGSGKSLVGLHRIDFFLSPHSDIGRARKPAPERVIMFGPSPAFLSYVSGLLPGLGVNRIRQTTVMDWLLDRFSARVTLSSSDRIFDILFSNRRRLTEAEIEAHRFKTGMRMKRLIDSYVSDTRRKILSGLGSSEGIVIRTGLGTEDLTLSAPELRGRASEALRRDPEPNVARQNLVTDLALEWLRLAPARPRSTRSEMIEEARSRVRDALSNIWDRLDFRAAYVDLVSSPEKLMKHAKREDMDLPTAQEIVRTGRFRATAGQALSVTDMAAALYLDYLLNGLEPERFEHVVVDEAQDVSPLELMLLRMNSANGTFTILGDLRQSDLPYKSITNWNQLASLFPKGDVSRLDSRTTYRSTKQITQYANRILQGLPERTKMPVPYGRGGSRPQLVRSENATEMRQSIAASVRDLLDLEDVGPVAVLTKWHHTSESIASALIGSGIEGVGVLTAGGTIDSRVTVSPIILTKGLEFDAVIVANAAKGNFTESEFDRILLYLACTRARHHLAIHWHGPRSPIVPDIARLSL